MAPATVTTSPITRRNAAEDAKTILTDVWGDAIPVDPVRIAKALGLRVVTGHLEPNVSGALIKEREQVPTILLNAEDSPNRQRFTCAHEIGHYVKRSEPGEEYSYIEYRGLLASTGRDPDEIYANQFAAELLMPAAEVRRLAAEGLSDLQMALRFDVSLEAMRWRLQNLGLQ